MIQQYKLTDYAIFRFLFKNIHIVTCSVTHLISFCCLLRSVARGLVHDQAHPFSCSHSDVP